MTDTWRILSPFLRRQWPTLVVAGVASVVIAVVEVLRPFPLKLVIDHLFAGGGAPDSLDFASEAFIVLAGAAGLVLAIALVEAAAAYLMDVKSARAGERIVHELRVAIYAHLQRLSLGFHQGRHTGDLVTRVTGDVNAVGTLFSSTLGTFVSASVTLVGMIVVGFLLDPVLALVAFATAPLLAVIAFRSRRRMGVLAKAQRAREGEIASLATEALGSIQQVKALGSEGFEHDRLRRKSEERLEAGYEATLVEGRFSRLIDILGAVGTAAVLVVGVFRVEAAGTSPGDVVVMVAYAHRVYRPLRTMAREWVRLSRAMARADRVAEILGTDDILAEGAGGRRDGRAHGTVVFDRVSFAYEPGRPALRDVSLTIPAGQRIAIVGRSGAGKSTLAALAARFYDPGSGHVLIDGVDARDHPVGWMRDQVGLVLQDTVLFTGSVAENIAWGIDGGRKEVVRAAEAAGADAFIRQLPDGYDTELDPGGTGLSGGQRQRIAIARTLLRDPAILLLDEPTTGLDAESEADVLAGLDALMSGRTTMIITHSLALASRAEKVAVLDAGRLIQEGEPGELMSEDGPFRRLAAEQGIATPPDRRAHRAPARAPAISDGRLPQSSTLLDPTAVAPVLARSLDHGVVPQVSIRYLRYKPGTNLVVHYDVATNGERRDAIGMIASGADLAGRAAKPESIALARLVGDRARAVSPLAYEPDIQGLFQWYPLDLSMPALACPPGELRRLLRAADVSVEPSDAEPERLAYKPRRRAVLRVDGHVIKLYRRPAEFERAVAGQRAASGLRTITTPRLEAVRPDRLLSAQSFLSGEVVVDPMAVAEQAGAMLAALHASREDGLPAVGPREQLEAAAASARLVATLAPELESRLEGLLESLARTRPLDSEMVPSHGDFNARQLLVRDGDLALTDFDEFCRAPAALDLATYAAYVVLGGPTDIDDGLATLDRVLAGYGKPVADVRWYLATMILRRSARPFRYFEPDWPARVGELVTAAEEALSRDG